ncbi:MAG: DUF4350 domain-containing protein [Myxococcales bacterium]
MRPGKFALAVLCIVALASLGVFAARVGNRGRFSAPYSTYGAGAEGTRALYRLVEELGLKPARLSHEISHLDAGTLFAIAGCEGEQVRPLLRPEREEVTRFVEAGGLLIVAGVEGYLPERSGLSFDQPADCSDPAKQSWLEELINEHGSKAATLPKHLEAVPSGAPLAHMLPFDAVSARNLRVAMDSEATVLLESEYGPLGLTAPFGRGRVVLLGVPEALTNRGLAQGGGVIVSRLLSAFAPAGPVWFDEYHLGMGERRSLIGYLRERGYGVIALQVLLVGLALLAAHSARLGRARPAPTTLPRQRQSYLGALSRMYEQCADEAGALQVLSRSALARLGRRYRAVGVEPERIAAWLESSGFHAVATCARKIEAHATDPLQRGESLLGRARKIEQDLTFAIALAEAGNAPGGQHGDAA